MDVVVGSGYLHGLLKILGTTCRGWVPGAANDKDGWMEHMLQGMIPMLEVGSLIDNNRQPYFHSPYYGSRFLDMYDFALRVMQCCCDCNLMAGNATKKRKRERILGYQVVSCNRTSFASSDTCSKQLNEQTLLNEEETRTDLQTCFNSVWKDRFYIRWPKGVKQTGFLASLMEDNTNAKSDLGIYRKDWQQCYWEAHLQECLREAAGQALIPSFEGSIANIILSGQSTINAGCHPLYFTVLLALMHLQPADAMLCFAAMPSTYATLSMPWHIIIHGCHVI
eukprot:Gb_32013 [translate_table: standard]